MEALQKAADAAGVQESVREGVLVVGLQLLVDAATGKASAEATYPLQHCTSAQVTLKYGTGWVDGWVGG